MLTITSEIKNNSPPCIKRALEKQKKRKIARNVKK